MSRIQRDTHQSSKLPSDETQNKYSGDKRMSAVYTTAVVARFVSCPQYIWIFPSDLTCLNRQDADEFPVRFSREQKNRKKTEEKYIKG